MMTVRRKNPVIKNQVVWERPEPSSPPAPRPLSREGIVRAAIAIADKDGLSSVSMRKVGAFLDAGTMRLYGYVSTKEELLELMVDVVYGEMLSAGPIDADWRDALRTIARRTRQATQEHRWFIDLLGGRPHLGPNALAYLEAAHAVLSDASGFGDIDIVEQALRIVNAYMIGAIQSEASEQRAAFESAMNETEWQIATGPYIHRMIATGRFPNLARVVRDATHLSADIVFDQGLDCVLDGIAARLSR